MKKAILFIIVLLLLLPTAALAEEIVTELDPFTGEPVGESTSSGTTASSDSVDLVYVSEGVYYDNAKRAFAHDLNEVAPAMLYCSIASGMVTTEAVEVTVPAGCTAILYRNGEKVETPNFSMISEPGSYVVSISGNSASSIQPLKFTILSELSGLLDYYSMPSGFLILAVTLDDEPVVYSPLEADLTGEGEYCVQYRCNATGNRYTLRFTTDHTPPVLALPGVVDGYARGPVDISDLEPEAEIAITLDNKYLTVPDKELTRSGVYDVVVRDAAGNTSQYHFTIMVYLNLNSYIFIAVFVILLAALAAYLLISRKRLRVR